MTVNYIGKTQCSAIKGIFILMVFFSHFQSYVAEAGGRVFDTHLGQLIVVMFLFYSGFGVMEQIVAKGDEYLRAMPKRRMLTTLLNFDVAVAIFIVVDLLIGRPIGLRQALLSFVCWESVGNSNWYIFSIILCYAVTWFWLRLIGKVWIVCLTLVAMTVALSAVRPSWWYDTMLCFPAGMLYSTYRKRVESLAVRHYWLVLIVVVGGFLLFRHSGFCITGLAHNAQAVFFSLMVVLLTMRLPIRSRPLEWCGVHLFPIYIYQRLPMIFIFEFDAVGFASWRGWLIYFPLCLGITLFVAKWYNKWQIRL